MLIKNKINFKAKGVDMISIFFKKRSCKFLFLSIFIIVFRYFCLYSLLFRTSYASKPTIEGDTISWLNFTEGLVTCTPTLCSSRRAFQILCPLAVITECELNSGLSNSVARMREFK